MKIRTRYAPSPTGKMHVGNLRTALYEFLIAKHEGGDFLFRIEDTDTERYVEGAIDIINNTMSKAGLVYDEGPGKDGGYGPYVQSERVKSGLYLEYAKQLVEKGEAYYCFCSKERLDKLRADSVNENGKETAKYDKHCLSLSKEEVEAKLAAGEPYVIRQNNPQEGTTVFSDIIYGDISVDNCELDDMVLIKADGYPTYNFANVIDDHLMKITHVVRGNEYLSSAPKYNLLYQAFGWDVPVYVHCCPVMKDQTAKLSKRNGDASFEDLIAKGYLTEAVINYIALLGWAPKGEQEIYSLEELAQEFDISGISKSPAIFDPVKLKAINAEYIRRMTPEQFCEYITPYIRKTVKRDDIDFKVLASVLQPRTELYTDIEDLVDFIDVLPEYDNSLYCHKKMKTNEETSIEALNAILPVLEALDEWNVEAIHTALFDLIAKLEVKNGWLLWPLRTAVSGKQVTAGGGVELCAILGKDESIARIKKGIEKLS